MIEAGQLRVVKDPPQPNIECFNGYLYTKVTSERIPRSTVIDAGSLITIVSHDHKHFFNGKPWLYSSTIVLFALATGELMIAITEFVDRHTELIG